jgi:hypothetical protein
MTTFHEWLVASGTFSGSVTADVIDAALASGNTKLGACITDNPAQSAIRR